MAGYTTALAAATNDANNPLVAYGLLGIILAIFGALVLAERLVSGKTLQRERDRADTSEAHLIEFVTVARDMVKATEEILTYLRSRQR